MKKSSSVLILFLITVGILKWISAVQQTNLETLQRAEEQLQQRMYEERVQQSISENLEAYQSQVLVNQPGEATCDDANRELVRQFHAFAIYEIMRDPDDPDDLNFIDYEIINAQTGTLLLHGPMSFTASTGFTIQNCFYPLDGNTLLWVQNCGAFDEPSVCYLVRSDGIQTPIECSFRITGGAGPGHFIFSQPDKGHPWTDRWGDSHDGYLYGLLDHDLKTILLPAELANPSEESGFMYPPYFSEGYLLAQKDGKFGIIGYDLKEKIPFVYDQLLPIRAQTYYYRNGEEFGILFLESGMEMRNVRYEAHGIRTLILSESGEAPQKSNIKLVDRSGNVLYTMLYEEANKLSYNENYHPLLNGKPLEISALTRKSDWAEPILNEARDAGLIPAELDQMYQSHASRRDFCMLAVQLIRLLRPELLEASEFPEQNPYWDCPEDLDIMQDINLAARLGILTGGGSFEPFLPVTRRDATMIIKNTARLLKIQGAEDVSGGFDFNSSSNSTGNGCTIEQVISAFWELYQMADEEIASLQTWQ